MLKSDQEEKQPRRKTMRDRMMRVALITTAIALLVAGGAMLANDLSVYRRSWAADLETDATILALSIGPALAFDDHVVALRNLSALRARQSILAAALYSANGRLYAQYTQDGVALPAPQLKISGHATHLFANRAEVTQPIVQNGEFLGTIYLRAQYDVIDRVKAYLGIFSLVTLASMGVALVLSSALQRAIIEPLDAIADVARRVVNQRDYSLRAKPVTDKDIGLLVEAFNNMLNEVQLRTRELEQSNTALTAEIKYRLSAEQRMRESEKLYRAIGESIDYGVWVCDAEGRNLYASESLLKLIGMTQEQCSGFGWSQALHPDDMKEALAAWQENTHSGNFWYREHRMLGVDGNYHPILAQGVPIRAEDGTISRWAGINLDISRLKQTEDALRDADRRKDEFIAVLAHELRNPLAPIRNAVKMLEASNATQQQQQWGRQVIVRQVQHMALLLDDLLDVSRITRAKLELRKTPITLAALIAAAVETARPLIDEKQHILETKLPPESVVLEVDPLRIAQALSNLLTNAAKYTDRGGCIIFSATVDDNNVVFTVSDNGIGLSATMIPSLFEMFSQVESALDRSQGGLGIGLALVKGFVSLHGGTVQAQSAGEGQGSIFTIRLPCSCIQAHTPQEPPAIESKPMLSNLKIVVADDNRDAAQCLALLLDLAGHEVHTAFSGTQALELAIQQRPNAMILDISMPDMNGYDIAQQIRETSWGKKILIIAITGWGQQSDADKMRGTVFDYYFSKPVDPSELENIFAIYLQQSRTVGLSSTNFS